MVRHCVEVSLLEVERHNTVGPCEIEVAPRASTHVPAIAYVPEPVVRYNSALEDEQCRSILYEVGGS